MVTTIDFMPEMSSPSEMSNISVSGARTQEMPNVTPSLGQAAIDKLNEPETKSTSQIDMVPPGTPILTLRDDGNYDVSVKDENGNITTKTITSRDVSMYFGKRLRLGKEGEGRPAGIAQTEAVSNRVSKFNQFAAGTLPKTDPLYNEFLMTQQENRRLAVQPFSQGLATGLGQLPPQGTYNVGEAALGAGVGALTGAAATVAATSLLSSVVSGAAAGSVVPGVGTLIGAGLGLVGGFVGKLAGEQRQDVKNALRIFSGAKTNMALIISSVNQGHMSASEAQIMWNKEVSEISHAKALLKWETKNSVNRFLSGGMDELIRIEEWEQSYPILRMQLQQAMLTPNPDAINNINYLTPDEIEELQ